MRSLEKRLEKLEFYFKLAIEMGNRDAYPFYGLIMDRELGEGDVQRVTALCDELSELLQKQKAQGLVLHENLLTQFAGQLTTKLPVNDTIHALYKQGLYTELMKEFIVILQHGK
ncbi:DUF1878 family protein [Bacillus lacus]|uniref:DUF1878 family protein n=1 Tax=Metabacillus lacus TaxID=1983721 RepID=A0A7X2IX61_9BACI|nr:DUF1878 family protein [Metabacillus lacus]MRX71461.1 DUF1878 family protein [Metabacillus lacus]